MKCGTTATRGFLQHHPDLIGAKAEAYFFNNDQNYNKRGMEWYLSLFPEKTTANQITYEKSPTYYKSVSAVSRIKSMNETIKLVNIVCDNVRRTLSRFLHIESHAKSSGKNSAWKKRLKGLGSTLDGFNLKLSKSIKTFQAFLNQVKQNEGNGTMEGLIEALLIRFRRRERPFGIGATKGEVFLRNIV